jgi:hypothetical protein
MHDDLADLDSFQSWREINDAIEEFKYFYNVKADLDDSSFTEVVCQCVDEVQEVEEILNKFRWFPWPLARNLAQAEVAAKITTNLFDMK